jgi:hypothetical protein
MYHHKGLPSCNFFGSLFELPEKLTVSFLFSFKEGAGGATDVFCRREWVVLEKWRKDDHMSMRHEA